MTIPIDAAVKLMIDALPSEFSNRSGANPLRSWLIDIDSAGNPVKLRDDPKLQVEGVASMEGKVQLEITYCVP